MPAIRIVLLCIAAAVAYGLVHDQITARISLEYFTIGHPRMFASNSPTLHALYWGVAATWWIGLALGILLALCARAGHWSVRNARDLSRPIAILLGVMLVLAAGAALAMHQIIRIGERNTGHPFSLAGPMFERFPRERHAAFAIAWAMHATSYAAGSIGGLVLCVHTLIRRRRSALEVQRTPRSPA